MVKDIVANLSVRKDGKPAGDYALSIASLLDAHVTGIAIAFVPSLPTSALGYFPVDILDEQRRDNEAAAQAAMERFSAASARACVAAEPRMVSTNFADAGKELGRIARRFDLAVVDQAKPDGSMAEAGIPEGVMFESGRPIIVVPYIQTTPLKLDRVMVCWDGRRAAARAVADAMPLLERAKNVEVVIVTNERGKRLEMEGADIGQHLARHGIKVEVTRIIRGDLDVADALLSHSADCGADFIVMGGYGHSRLREFVLGGVTRKILQCMPVPAMMSH
jgi:nucleotide-binding universal stress UspA family protein